MKQIQILYFARIREELGLAEESVTLPDSVQTVADLTQWLAGRGADWAVVFSGKRIFRVAINQDMARPGDAIPAGAEVAIFPPVTGG